jgi:hypothetical protein
MKEHVDFSAPVRRTGGTSSRWIPYCLVAASALGCASVKTGQYAVPLDATGALAKTSVTAAGLLISGTEVSDVASPYFGLLEITFENPTAQWVRIERTALSFGAANDKHAVISEWSDILGWERAIRQRNAVRSVNVDTGLTLLAIGGAVGAAAISDRPTAAAAAATSLVAASALTGTNLAERAREVTTVPRFPESHLLAGPFSVPPGLFIKKWLVVNTKDDVPGRCLARLTLSYQTAGATWDHVLLTFKDLSSEWQQKGCTAARQAPM